MTQENKNLKLYEIVAVIRYATVIAAVSEEDAKEHVATWEKSWHESSDLIEVMDTELTDVRDLEASDWKDEAHDITPEARQAIGGDDNE